MSMEYCAKICGSSNWKTENKSFIFVLIFVTERARKSICTYRTLAVLYVRSLIFFKHMSKALHIKYIHTVWIPYFEAQRPTIEQVFIPESEN